MKAWLLDQPGGVDGLRLAEVPDPAPGAGEVLLGVHYAALNPADRYLSEGQYPARPPMPHILGRDGMGEVIALGKDVSGWNVGDTALVLRSGEIGVSRHGTLAEKVAVPAVSIAKIPRGWTDPQAAAGPL